MIFDSTHTIRVADIPGLIQDAHKGIGLGHDFLRHIERTHFLLFVVDMAGYDGRDPVDDFRSLKEELCLYNPALLERPYWVVANKMDEEAAQKNLQSFRRRTKEKPIPLSAALGEGIPELKTRLFQQFFPDERVLEF